MSKPTVRTHSYQHFEDLQLSSKEFYSALENLIKGYQYPDVTLSVVAKREGGIASSSREYLQVSKAPYNFLICAAPFGRSFFVSWWMEDGDDWLTAFFQRLPLIGRLFGPYAKSYYQVDTELIFTQSIDAIVRAAVGKLAAEHGYRQPDMKLAE
ncbi:hypothetical protein SAMN05216464_1091 [Mucilaginibacter pineti]|uniref:Uncharacterized protein n=1 Tax=Mucilaginibacter pineti TaxID=1391627 RepID=A0A1G7FCW3_9SPHI|nr:hypothetical protein [Mucilaginibacter pineti]SDE73732.1 hypothetical protein SAMN05216464_1091 [Mucilaginibacter pineti]